MVKAASISDPEDLETSWDQQYARLATQFASMLPRISGIVVEVGCGKGQLTIPLAKTIRGYRIIALDRYRGPYKENQTALSSTIADSRLKTRVTVVVSDYSSWLKSRQDAKYDSIISSEFLPEITSQGMRSFFRQCYRILKPEGVTIHSFLSPQPRNEKQRRLIEADSDPRWTKTPPSEWFSPRESLVMEYLKLAGFRKLRLVRLRSGLVIRSKAARELLRDWDIRQSYWKLHSETLEKEGLEIPDWIIIGGVKPS